MVAASNKRCNSGVSETEHPVSQNYNELERFQNPSNSYSTSETTSLPKIGDNETNTCSKTGTSSSSSDSDDSTSDPQMEQLQKYLAEKLGIFTSDEKSSDKTEKVLNKLDLDGIVDYINTKNCSKIITMAGAGISTSAGIPDFRSPGTGLYHNLQKYNLPHPQAIFELDFFKDNPKPFFELAKELYPGNFKPTICHYFIKLLAEKGMLLRHYTQNIDALERVAGVPEEKLVEAHGTFYTGHCLNCRHVYSLEWLKGRIFKDEIPICEECPGVVKPDIVFFGEALPTNFYEHITSDFGNCDLLIILGSSLAVQPFASLIDRVPDNVPRLLINREKAGQRTGIMAMLGMAGGLEFDSKDNSRDVFWLGDCDHGCELLAEKLGLGADLKELCISTNENLQKEETQQ